MRRTVVGRRERDVSHRRSPALAHKGTAAVLVFALLACLGWAASFASSAISVTNTNDGGAGSLRAAIAAAAPGETINFAPGVTGVITLTTGELLVNKDLTINGPGARLLTVSGNNSSRVFHIQAGTVHLSGLTISNANAASSGGGISGGDVLTLDACVVSNNSAPDGGGIHFSGATLTITNSTVSGNTATTTSGGGITITGDAADITNSTISNNFALTFGGGIDNAGVAVMNITASTVTANTAQVNAGGIQAGGNASNVRGSIIAANSATSNPDIEGLFNSQGFNLIGKQDSSSGFEHGTNGDLVGTSAAPINPLLGPLANNGGPTDTHALLNTAPASPAIDAGANAVNGPPFNLSTDQRGSPRRFGAQVDIGAYELQNNFTVTSTNDAGAGSLRQAILNANAQPNSRRRAGCHQLQHPRLRPELRARPRRLHHPPDFGPAGHQRSGHH